MIFTQKAYGLHIKNCRGQARPTPTRVLGNNTNNILPTTNTTYLKNYTYNPNIVISKQPQIQQQPIQNRTISYRPQTATYYNPNQPSNYSQYSKTQIPSRNNYQRIYKCNICGESMADSAKKDHLLCHKLEQEDKDLLQAQRLQDEDLFNNVTTSQVEEQLRIEDQIKRQQRQGQNNYRNNNVITNDFNIDDDDMSMGITNLRNMGNLGNMSGMTSIRNINGIPNITIRRGGNMGNFNDLSSGMGSPDFFSNFFNGINNDGFENGSGFRRIMIPMGGMGGQMGDQGDLNELIERMLHYSRENPTDATIVSELPETKIDDIKKLDNDKKNCVICMEDFKNGDKSTNLPCLHMFHTNCIQSWLKTQNTCPICKFKLTPENINNINRRG